MHPGHTELTLDAGSKTTPGGSAGSAREPVAVRVFPGMPKQVPLARKWVLALLTDRLVDLEAAEVIAAELVTNAILHTASGNKGGKVTVAVTADSFIHVHDQGGQPDPAREMPLTAPGGPREGGQGFVLVTALSQAWELTPAAECTAGGPGDPAPATRGGCTWAQPLPAVSELSGTHAPACPACKIMF